MTYRIVVIDDIRVPEHPPGVDVVLFQTPDEGLAGLKALHGEGMKIDELWLDHDMGIDYETGNDLTIRPVVDWLDEVAPRGQPVQGRLGLRPHEQPLRGRADGSYSAAQLHDHAGQPPGGEAMREESAMRRELTLRP